MATEGKNVRAGLAAIAAIAAILTAAVVPAHAAEPEAKPACASSITTCGCTINRSGSYVVANNLDASQGLTAKGDCIDIAAPFVLLNVNSATITGSGKGAGINVLGAAHNTIVEGAVNGSSDNGQGVITGWDVGVMVGANSTIVELFNPIGGTEANPQGNFTAGVALNGVSDCTIDDITSTFNGAGALVSNSSRIRMFNFTASHNDNSGIQMQGSSNSTLSNMTANNNGQYGIILLNSDQNQISTFGATSNSEAGISIGCEHGFAGCPANGQPSARNKVSNGGSRTNGRAGVVVNLKSSNNQVTVVTAAGNNKGGSDLSDGNANCDKNQWFNNSFGSASPSCIR